jgi:hypothetical protein
MWADARINDHRMIVASYLGEGKGTEGPSRSCCSPISGAGEVNPPVLNKLETGLMMPALPICKMEELFTLFTRN